MTARRTADLGQGCFQGQGRGSSLRHGKIMTHAEGGVGQDSSKRNCRYPDSEPEHEIFLLVAIQTITAHPGQATPRPDPTQQEGGASGNGSKTAPMG